MSGRPGDDFVRLLARTVGSVAKARGFPPPEGHTRWTQDAVLEMTSAFLGDDQTPRRLADFAVHCKDDNGLRARLQGAVVNFFRDRARRTEIGRFIRRLRDVLVDIDGIVSVGDDRWRLVMSPDSPSSASPGALEGAANRERQVVKPDWRLDTRRNPPAADRPTIARLAQRVLTVAEGSLSTAELARAMAPRLGLRAAPLTVSLGSGFLSDPADIATDPADLAMRAPRALDVFRRLSVRQRLIVANLNLSSRMIKPVIGVSHTQAAIARSQVISILKEELVNDSDGDAIALEVIEMAKNWYSNRTTDDGSP